LNDSVFNAIRTRVPDSIIIDEVINIVPGTSHVSSRIKPMRVRVPILQVIRSSTLPTHRISSFFLYSRICCRRTQRLGASLWDV